MQEKELLKELNTIFEKEEEEKQRKISYLYEKYGEFIQLIGTKPVEQFLELVKNEIEEIYIKDKNNLTEVPDDVLIKEKYFLLGMKQSLELVKDLCNPVHYSQADKS